MAANTSIVALFDDIVASTNILTAGSEGSKSSAGARDYYVDNCMFCRVY